MKRKRLIAAISVFLILLSVNSVSVAESEQQEEITVIACSDFQNSDGASAIYLAKGDEILIAQNSQTEFETETLNFTYMNAGYVGYYNNMNAGSETHLTMTVFKIKGKEVSISRYSQDGIFLLKAAGVTNSYKQESGYLPNTKIYASPQTLNGYSFDTQTDNVSASPTSDNTEKTGNTVLYVTAAVIFTVTATVAIAIILKRRKKN